MTQIASPPSSSPTGGAGGELAEIEGHVLKAVNELLRRAWLDATEPTILDRKDDDAALCKGLVQDCEFGLMVLVARKELDPRRLTGELADAGRVKALTLALVRRTVDTVTDISNLSFSGGGELVGSPVFFSGQPYTGATTMMGDEPTFSANLDSAMLTIAFLAIALAEFDADLSALDPPPNRDLKARGVRNLRDAALLVCHEGLLYATKCRVREQDHFLGYTCDPTSNLPGSPPGILDDYDRLFFTWTTCETVHELAGWLAYLKTVEETESSPPFLPEIKNLLVSLMSDLKEASLWCRRTFLKEFGSLTPPPVARVVQDFNRLGAKRPDADLDKDCDTVARYVTNVYHLSQYAAVRSIEPVDISLDEARGVVNQLDTLVGQHILSSGLDAASHQRLFRTLSRTYSLGKSNESLYKDDAYFPLVVRSLSGLLNRTMTTLGKTATREEILGLVLEFRRSLKARYENLVDRRPERHEPGDDYLWSFVAGKPYVLYATQRTIYSLLEYAKFLEVADEYERLAPKALAAEAVAEEIRDLLARSLAEVLIGPVVHKFVENVASLRSPVQVPAAALPTVQPPVLPLPEPEWTHPALLNWLVELKEAFEHDQKQVEEFVEQKADALMNFQSRLLGETENAATAKVLRTMRGNKENLLKLLPELGALDGQGWNRSSVMPALFHYIVRRHMKAGKAGKSLKTALQADPKDESDLWAEIERASDSISTLDRQLDKKAE
jgi:hypothetical protein